MFDWLMTFLIMILLLIKILDYFDLLEDVTTLLGLIATALVATVKLAIRLVRSVAGSSTPQQ